MKRLIVRRRRDGLVQLRRRRLWHVISVRETAAILVPSAASVALVVLVATISILPRLLIALAPLSPVVALGVWAAHATRAPASVTAPVDDPPPPPPRRIA
jgi:hypothetical protein